MKTNLQVPISKSLKISSEKVAKEYGFSSLQQVVRLFLAQLADRKVTIRFASDKPDEILTNEQEEILTKKYLQAKKEISEGKGFTAESAEELIKQLRSV